MDDDSDISGSRNMNLTGASSVASVELDEASAEDPQDEVDGAAAVATTHSPERKLPQMLTVATR